MKVYIVVVSDCEGMWIEKVCATKEIAERELFKVRDKIVKNYDTKYGDLDNLDAQFVDAIERCKNNLSGDNYEEWCNFPHETPSIIEEEVLDE